MLHSITLFFTNLIFNLESIVRQGGYSVLFIVSFLEGLPIIGQFVPGHTIVIFSGFLTKIGILNIYSVLILVVFAAMLGDITGFLFGRKYGFTFLKKFGKYFFVTEAHIEKARRLITEHVGKTIVLGRFSPITRQLTPFIVGASGIHIHKFWLFDFIGVLLWTISSVLIGYIFGAGYHIAAPALGKFIVIAIILSLLILWAYKFVNKQFHIFAKYELITLTVNIASLFVFFKTLQDAVSEHSFLAELDVWMNLFVSARASSWGLLFMNVITDIFSPEVLFGITTVCVAYFLVKRQWRYSAITILATGGGLVIGAFMKELIMRVRPINSIILETGYSFPSGHAISVTIFFTLIVYLFVRRIHSLHLRETFIVLSVLLVLITSFSRIYLGVHWLTDVVAGISLGLFWTTLMILLVRYISMIIVRLRQSSPFAL